MKNIAVLVSGNGTNLQSLINAQKAGALGGGEICLVISSNPDAYALTRAKNNGIPAETVDYGGYKRIEDGRRIFSETVLNRLMKRNADLVVEAGFNIILDEVVCKTFPDSMINVHPSLIPSFCGLGYYGLKVHEAVLERGVKVTGATVHFVNHICDGGPIILQKAVEVADGDTPETLQKRVMEEAEQIILPEAVMLFCERRIKVEGGRTVIRK